MWYLDGAEWSVSVKWGKVGAYLVFLDLRFCLQKSQKIRDKKVKKNRNLSKFKQSR